jgi:hypothetical protein
MHSAQALTFHIFSYYWFWYCTVKCPITPPPPFPFELASSWLMSGLMFDNQQLKIVLYVLLSGLLSLSLILTKCPFDFKMTCFISSVPFNSSIFLEEWINNFMAYVMLTYVIPHIQSYSRKWEMPSQCASVCTVSLLWACSCVTFWISAKN